MQGSWITNALSQKAYLHMIRVVRITIFKQMYGILWLHPTNVSTMWSQLILVRGNLRFHLAYNVRFTFFQLVCSWKISMYIVDFLCFWRLDFPHPFESCAILVTIFVPNTLSPDYVFHMLAYFYGQLYKVKAKLLTCENLTSLLNYAQ